MPARVSAIPNAGHSQTNSSGPPGGRGHAHQREVSRRGRVYLSNASVRGAFVLRACIVNHRTTDADVAAVVDEVLAAAAATA